MNDFIASIDRLHTTELGAVRIKRNLGVETDDVVQWCKTQILQKNALMERAGKNWYITTGRYRITINAHSYTIITAHTIRQPISAEGHPVHPAPSVRQIEG